MDLFDAAEHGGSVEAGLARIRASQTLVIGVETDFLFPLDQQEEIAALLRKAGRTVRFEAHKLIVPRPDLSDSAADVLAEPLLVARAVGTFVVRADRQRRA